MTSEIFAKRPFTRVLPSHYLRGVATNDVMTAPYYEGRVTEIPVSQADFKMEYYPSGHRINDPSWYHNIVSCREATDANGNSVLDEKGRPVMEFFEQAVFRAAFPFQMMITAQHLVHLFGNDIHHELTGNSMSEEDTALFTEWQEGWIRRNMDIAAFNFGKSDLRTGDAALVFYMHKGKMRTKVLSYIYGDTLYPHCDNITGEMEYFARKFRDYDEEGNALTEFVEIWDDTYLYRYKKSLNGAKDAPARWKDRFGLDGYVLYERPQKHGGEEVPVVYKRSGGPVWRFVQDSIEKYEVAVSQLCQNNMAYAFPIMVLKSENNDYDIQGDMYGAVKAIVMGKDDEASYLQNTGSAESFKLQLDTLLRQIFNGSFVVAPPEVKSGDLPGVAIKLIYSPSIDAAIIESKSYDNSIDKMQRLFTHFYGIEKGKVTQFKRLHILSYIIPYVHQNTAELINNIVQAKNSGILSGQTASELSTYGLNDEWERIIVEQKQQQQADRLYQLKQTAG